MTTNEKIVVLFFFVLLGMLSCDPPSPPVSDDDPGPIDTIPPTPVDTTLNSNILFERPAHYPGFIPSKVKKDYSTPAPELLDRSNAFFVTESVGGWENVNWGSGTVLITPGNYVEWGDLVIPVSGTPEKPLVVMYYDPQAEGIEVAHGYDTDQDGRAANIEGLVIGDRRNPESYITISGLTFKGQSWQKDGVRAGSGIFITPGGSDIKILNCYSYKWKGARLFGDRITFENNFVAGSLGVRGDHGAVGLYTTEKHGSYNCRIVGNTIIDQNNLIGIPKDGREETTYRFVNGLVVADNDLYFTDESIFEEGGQLFSCGGSGIDVKNGSNDPSNPVIITNNRFAYIYPNPPSKECGDNNGKLGEGIILHKDAQNIVISDNYFHDVTRGIMVYSGEVRDMTTENVLIINNVFSSFRHYSIPGLDEDATGKAFHVSADHVDIIYNTIIGATYLATTKAGKRIDFRGNRYSGNPKGLPESSSTQTVKDNFFGSYSDIPLAPFHLEWRRGEVLTLPDCVPDKDQVQVIENTYQDSETGDYLETVWYQDNH